MIYPSINLITMDNSEAKKVKCIKVYKKPGRARNGANIGDLIQVTVISLRNRGLIRVIKGEIYTGVVTRVSTTLFRKTKGYYIKFALTIKSEQKEITLKTCFDLVFNDSSQNLNFLQYGLNRIPNLSILHAGGWSWGGGDDLYYRMGF